VKPRCSVRGSAAVVATLATVVTLVTLVTLGVFPTPLAAQTVGADQECTLCHGELELLRQQVPTLDAARALLVPHDRPLDTAHDTIACVGCHDGFDPFPHPDATATESCASCHDEEEAAWTTGLHATEEDPTLCAACHTVHDVAGVDELAGGAGMLLMNATCVDCHDTSVIPRSDPHADSIPCASCHAPHDTKAVDAADALVAPLTQFTTCGECHEEVSDSIRGDAHGTALIESPPATLALLAEAGGESAPACTSCHGTHGMLAPSHERFDQDMVDQCAACHQDYADTYFGTYHGKATAVGSEIVATCDHCHGAHDILPADEPASMVADANLVETCGACHDNARPAFVEYDSHPDPMDRERNAPLFYAFVFMNTLLFGTLGLFGLHTALWWLRLTIDRRREEREEGP